MTIRDVKMFLAISRDLSTDSEFKRIERLNNSTMSDKSAKWKNFDYYFSNYALRKNLTFCQFPDLPIEFCESGCIGRL